MRIELPLLEAFGTHLADGSAALEYRIRRIEPYMNICDEIVLDFTGVRHANSSFVNAMISGILQRYGKSALDVLVFKGCNPIIRVLVGAAIDLGLQKVDEALAV